MQYPYRARRSASCRRGPGRRPGRAGRWAGWPLGGLDRGRLAA